MFMKTRLTIPMTMCVLTVFIINITRHILAIRLLMLAVSKVLLKYSKTTTLKTMFSVLRPAIVGLVAAAAILLMSAENFGNPQTEIFKFVTSILLFIFVFIGNRIYRIHPILLLVLSGIAGLIIY